MYFGAFHAAKIVIYPTTDCGLPFVSHLSFTTGTPRLCPTGRLLSIFALCLILSSRSVGQACGSRHGVGSLSLALVGSPGRRIPLSVAYPVGCSLPRRLVPAVSTPGGLCRPLPECCYPVNGRDVQHLLAGRLSASAPNPLSAVPSFFSSTVF